MKTKIEAIRTALLQDLEAAADEKALEAVRIKYLGRKGQIQSLFKELRALPPEERPRVGALINELKSFAEEAIARRKGALLKAPEPPLDVTLPGRRPQTGLKHPLTQVMREIVSIFQGLGFEVVESPEVEWDYYNFEALNIPAHHPARDMWSTLFITDRMLLRTHTSPAQIRTMESRKPPLRVVVPGRVYRLDPFDPSHAPAFYQMEGFYVDRNVSFAELKGTLELFVREFFGPDTPMRFVPSYFPFTEPSAEVHVLWKGPAMEKPEWLEILGCGMIHPNVFRAVGYDPDEWTGYAFGFGIDRMTMIKYGIDDIRLFYENDLRFLKEVGG